jgi:hydrogenase maturation protein HypF
MRWVHIHIEGIVQGVGFRPFVFKLANWLHLKGWVCNGVDGVHIEVGGNNEQIEMFQYLLKDDAPAEAHISSFHTEEIEPFEANDFNIVESNPLGTPNLLITPDLGLCDSCRQDVLNNSNKRYNYPFTTCTHCGPRYSILRELPYDRHTTSMHEFSMCKECNTEYHNPTDRRHFSQTNSCPDCSIPLRVIDNNGYQLSSGWEETVPVIIRALKEGKIIAVKGIGGYLLMTDATNENAIKTLRERKHRPRRPFALMYPDVDVLKHDVELTEPEEQAFQSIQSPIVLTKVKSNPQSGICVNEIAPGLNHIGVMQPYTAMFYIILREWGKPLIATSGNLSGSPIVYEDDRVVEALGDVADLFLIHDREIQISEDDSVVRFSKNHRLVIRRSKGYAPTMLNDNLKTSEECILAMGADMKGAFSLQANGRIYVSQYLGDLESYESQQYYRHTLDHLLKLLRVKPQHIVIDTHPNYFSSQLGKQLSEIWGVSYEEVYHHQAHAWSVLAENNLLDSEEPVLCVMWDGTGYGEDKQIWGGEFFEYQNKAINRVAQLSYTPVWQGDVMAREPRLSALYSLRTIESKDYLKDQFTEKEWNYYSKLIQTNPTIYTSSIGRVFDAVASLLNVCQKNTFEGEAAMLVEAVAMKSKCPDRYEIQWVDDTLYTPHLFKQILEDMDKLIPIENIAYKFHAYLAGTIKDYATNHNYKKIALSGGVFQNALLIDLIEEDLNPEVMLFLHKELSSNDENISLGQLTAAAVINKLVERENVFETINY